MANIFFDFSNGEALFSHPSPPSYFFPILYNWDAFMSKVNQFRDVDTFELACRHPEGGFSLSETEFRVIKESDETLTLQRKHYVNNVFVSYVNVEDGMNGIETIDRINYIYVNGTLAHHNQIAALGISASTNNCTD